MRAGGSAINALTDAARRVIGGRGSSVVENEIKRLVTQTGKTADQIADDILNGRILAENETIKAAVRAYRASGGEASTVIMQAMTPRPAVTATYDSRDGAHRQDFLLEEEEEFVVSDPKRQLERGPRASSSWVQADQAEQEKQGPTSRGQPQSFGDGEHR